jgi:hypothetical protein
MCGWDGTVKILSYGVSSVEGIQAWKAKFVDAVLHVFGAGSGEATDAINLFSLGAMFYEMVTERKAFDREDAEDYAEHFESTPSHPCT